MANADPARKNDVLDFATLVNALAKDAGVPKNKVQAVLKALSSASADALKQGKTVKIAGFGTLRVRDKAPASGGQAAAASRKVVLAAAKELKSAVEGK